MDNVDGSRPDRLQVTLLADGNVKMTIALNKGNDWQMEITGLPVNNAQGNEIVYSWKEEDVPGYTSSKEIQGNETIFINTHVPELVSVSVRKIWDDNNNAAGKRPEQIVMHLNNGRSVTLNRKNNWTGIIKDLPATYEGRKIEYTWTEPEVLGYNKPTVETTGSMTVFTNSLWTRTDEKPKHGKKPPLPGDTTEKLDDYKTPLGVNVLINHVGDCFD